MADRTKTTSHRAQQTDGADTTLSQARDIPASAVVVLTGAPVPDYTKADARSAGTFGGGTVRTVTADDSSPASSPPAGTVQSKTARFGHVVFHVVWPGGGSGNAEVWVDGGLDANGDAIGWLLVETVTGVVDRREYRVAVGQRPSFVRIAGTAGVNGGAPATVRTTAAV